MQTSGRFII